MASRKSSARKAKATTWAAGSEGAETSSKAAAKGAAAWGNAWAQWPGVNSFKSVEGFMGGGKTQLDKAAQEAANAGRDAMETAMKSGNVWARYLEDVSKVYMNLAQETTEKQSEAWKAIMGCKTINEFTETQNRLAQQSFDSMMSNATRLSEMSIRAATDCFEPINDQFSKAMKKASDTMAA